MSNQLNSNIGLVVGGQGLYELSATRKHPLGSRMVRGDKVYHYAKSGETMTSNATLARCSHAQTIMYAAVAADASPETNILTVTVANTDGLAHDGAFAKDDLAGGSVTIFTDAAVNYILHHDIVGSSVVAAGGGTLTLTLGENLGLAVTAATSKVEVMCSQYLDVTTAGNDGGRFPFVGVPMRVATTTEPYHWVQTWGPCWVAPSANVGLAFNNEVIAVANATIDVQVAADADKMYAQHIGYVLTHPNGADTQAAPFIFLQIAC